MAYIRKITKRAYPKIPHKSMLSEIEVLDPLHADNPEENMFTEYMGHLLSSFENNFKKTENNETPALKEPYLIAMMCNPMDFNFIVGNLTHMCENEKSTDHLYHPHPLGEEDLLGLGLICFEQEIHMHNAFQFLNKHFEEHTFRRIIVTLSSHMLENLERITEVELTPKSITQQ